MGLCGFVSAEARECGPTVHGIKSLVRFMLWKAIRIGIVIRNLVETGNNGSEIFSRVFIVKAEKPL